MTTLRVILWLSCPAGAAALYGMAYYAANGHAYGVAGTMVVVAALLVTATLRDIVAAANPRTTVAYLWAVLLLLGTIIVVLAAVAALVTGKVYGALGLLIVAAATLDGFLNLSRRSAE